MTRCLKSFFLLTAVITLLLLSGCIHADQNTVIDKNTVVNDQNWSYVNKVKMGFKIDDVSASYNLYLNLRITPEYKYSNIFVLVHQTGPNGKTQTTRFEFKLANPDGEWLGEGSGNLYSYQTPFRLNYKFPARGNYQVELEQNMRDNPLHSVSDVGLRVEKAE